ncbi:ribosome silencing factor [Candidatus Endomicrobiellum trichonymphae]|uniref:Ribosomal silencing factor RsfS n=1 Tax=Endomicrobium trichonymphae TaxID=1408204 RepID=B1H031_ENDTX|nr:ribosome silencing factor [Candidatus Endomicrobium trichonymphae]BAG13863.1 ribosome silencing factor [Candidatus Endomicrobium trichonymphae]
MAKINFLALAEKAAEIADNKKAIDTIILDIRGVTAIANYFVITTALSTPQINAISIGIEKIFKEQDIKSLRKDGVSSSSWRVIDYGGIVIHVMSTEIRESYKLEKLWKNSKVIESKILKVKSEKQLADIESKSAKTKKELKKLKNQLRMK